MFALHPRLEADTVPVGRLTLSRILLMRDRSVPWLILVPERPGVREIHDLCGPDRAVLVEEIAAASRALVKLHRPDKINVGALGNLVPQLHVHVVGRFASDRAWPGPIWGAGPPAPCGEEELAAAATKLRAVLLEEWTGSGPSASPGPRRRGSGRER